MKEEQCIIYITFLTCAFAFNLSCPELGHWNHRATAYCFDLNKYTCLLDTTKNRYTETCDGPREEIVGYRTTINRNNFNTVQCKSERYQIQDFTTVGNSDCIFQKSKCAQEGQVVYKVNNDSSVEDTKCMCDYTKGYSFVTLPISRCFCTPSVEDCSCFREFCPSDYQCTTEYELRTRSLNCTNILFSDDGGDDRHMIRRNMAQDDPNIDISNIIAATITVISLIIMIIGLLCWYHRKTIKDKIGGVMILAHYKEHKSNSENTSCSPIEGEEIEHVKTHYKEHKSNSENTSCSPIEGEEIEHVKSTPEQHANNDISDSANDDTGSEGSDHFSTASENHENSTDDSGATTQKYEISKPVCKKDENNLVSGTDEPELEDHNKESDIIPKIDPSLSHNEGDKLEENGNLKNEPELEDHNKESGIIPKIDPSLSHNEGDKLEENGNLKTDEQDQTDTNDKSKLNLTSCLPSERTKVQESDVLNTDEQDQTDTNDESKVNLTSCLPSERTKVQESDDLNINEHEQTVKNDDSPVNLTSGLLGGRTKADKHEQADKNDESKLNFTSGFPGGRTKDEDLKSDEQEQKDKNDESKANVTPCLPVECTNNEKDDDLKLNKAESVTVHADNGNNTMRTEEDFQNIIDDMEKKHDDKEFTKGSESDSYTDKITATHETKSEGSDDHVSDTKAVLRE